MKIMQFIETKWKNVALISLIAVLLCMLIIPSIAATGDVMHIQETGGGGLWEVDGTETQLIIADELDIQNKSILNVLDIDGVNIGTLATTVGTHTTDIGTLQGLSHTQGTDTTLGIQTANLNMGAFAIANVGNVDGVDVSGLSSTVSTHTTQIAGLDTRLTTAEGNIVTLQTDLDTAEAAIVVAEGDIDTLQSDLDIAESDIDTLESGLTTHEAATTGVHDFDKSARAYHSVAQTCTNGVWLTLAFDSERWDTDAIHDTITNNSRLTCKTEGTYLIVGIIRFASDTTGYRSGGILLNGIDRIGEQGGTPGNVVGYSIVSPATIWDLSVNDYVELRAYQNSGGNLNVDALNYYSPTFSMTRIS